MTTNEKHIQIILNIVQFEWKNLFVNTAVTSKESILTTCRKLVSEKGISVLNMRTVAKSCNVALGSIYYYFPSKNDLLIATIESVWEDIFKLNAIDTKSFSFSEFIKRFIRYFQKGIQKYPNFFTVHSISFSTYHQNKAQDSMKHYLAQIKNKMLESLNSDEKIRKDAFSDVFLKSDFIDFVLSNIICLLIQKKQDCTQLIEIIRRTIY